MNSLWHPRLREKGDHSLALVDNGLKSVSYCRPWPPRPWPLIMSDAFLYDHPHTFHTWSLPPPLLVDPENRNPGPGLSEAPLLLLVTLFSGVNILPDFFSYSFLAPSGAQGVTIFVRSSVRPVLVCLELLTFIFWHQILQDDLRMTSGHSQVILRSVSGQSQASLISVSGLSVLTSSDRRSLKYFVLLHQCIS